MQVAIVILSKKTGEFRGRINYIYCLSQALSVGIKIARTPAFSVEFILGI